MHQRSNSNTSRPLIYASSSNNAEVIYFFDVFSQPS